MKLAVAAIARPTFDVPFAEDTARRAFAALDALEAIELEGPREVVLDEAGLASARAAIEATDADVLVILQASFAAASTSQR